MPEGTKKEEVMGCCHLESRLTKIWIAYAGITMIYQLSFLTKHHLYTLISKKDTSFLTSLLVKTCLYSPRKPELSFLISLLVYDLSICLSSTYHQSITYLPP